MNLSNIQKVSELALHGTLHDRLPSTRLGAFFAKYPYDIQSKIPVAHRALPVLTNRFDDFAGKVRLDRPGHVGWGAMLLEREVLALTFRLQLGPNVLYWLANPCDPAVWAVLDQWHAAGNMVVHASFDQGPAFMVSRDFKLPAQLSQLRSLTQCHEQSKRPFFSAATRLLQSGLSAIASSDLAAFPKLETVQGCVLCTVNSALPDVQLTPTGIREEGDAPSGSDLPFELTAEQRQVIDALLAQGARPAPGLNTAIAAAVKEMLQKAAAQGTPPLH